MGEEDESCVGKTFMVAKNIDLLVIASLVFVALLFNGIFVDFTVPPFEDAAMLMRYAIHIALGHGIVWNIDGKPLDGATDFLFMMTVGGLTKVVPVEVATRSLVLVSHFLTIIFIYISMRRILGAGVLASAVSALYVIVGPGAFLSAAYFGTSFFVMFVCITWIAALKMMQSRPRKSHIAGFALLSVVLGMIRPEGVFIALFILAGIVVTHGFRRSKSIIGVYAVVFTVVGGAYFLWRWNYFGHPLPNPFYVKGGGLNFVSLRYSLLNTIALCPLFLPIYLLGLRSGPLRKETLVYGIPIIGMTLMWILMSNEMNTGGRFQYPILPIVLLSWYPIVKGLRKDLTISDTLSLQAKTAIGLFIGVIFVSGFVIRASTSMEISFARDGRYDVAQILRPYADLGYTMVTTEAGLLPLYSEWRAVDAWGLNDPKIAQKGRISTSYLRQIDPDIIVWHSRFSPLTEPKKYRSKNRWKKMVLKLKKYAEENGYILMGAFGPTPYDAHYYYCSPTLPVKDEIIREIRSLKYGWYQIKKNAVDFSKFSRIRKD